MNIQQPITADSLAPIRKIAIYRALFLGDQICVVPALRALKERFPEAEITLIGLPWARDLVERLPYVDRLLAFPGYRGINEVPYQPEVTAAFLAEARAYQYDIAIQMHGNGTVSNGFVAELGAQASFGYRQGHDRRLTMTIPYWPAEHEVLRWLRLVQVVHMWANRYKGGAQPMYLSSALEFPTTEVEEDAAAMLLADAPPLPGPLVGLHVGGSDPKRRWPPERFAALADELVARHHARVVLTGGPGEEQIAAAVRQAMRAPAVDLAGRTNLGVFASLIGQLDLLVTNDTGASHVAAAKGTRSVVLFGPSRPEGWAPLNHERHRVVDALALASRGTDPALALRQLPVEAVAAVCDDALRATGDWRRETEELYREMAI